MKRAAEALVSKLEDPNEAGPVVRFSFQSLMNETSLENMAMHV